MIKGKLLGLKDNKEALVTEQRTGVNLTNAVSAKLKFNRLDEVSKLPNYERSIYVNSFFNTVEINWGLDYPLEENVKY